MKGLCRVCRFCDGVTCAGEVPGMGGIGTGSSFGANIKALENVKINLRTPMMQKLDISFELFGKSYQCR